MTLQVSIPIRVPAIASVRRAMETAPDETHEGRAGLRGLLGRAWQVATAAEGRPTASRRDDLVTSLLSGLLVLGLFLDGWNHLNLQEGRLGPFLTPWHAGLYFGFTVTALWIVTRCQRSGAWCLARVPRGYGSALVGMGISTVAMAGDAIWHAEFGVELGTARVIAPFHLLLFVGALLLVTSSFRSAWSAKTPARVNTLRQFAPQLLSITLATAMVAFLFQFASPLVMWVPTSLVRLSTQSPFHETMQIYGLLAVLVTNLILVTPVMIILRRWEPPFGTITVLFGVVGLLSAAMTNLAWGGLVAASLAGGMIADLAVARLRPTPLRPAASRAAGAIIPVGLWASHFAALHFGYGITWPAEFWVGSIVFAGFAGVALSLLTVPSRMPAAVWAVADVQATTDPIVIPTPAIEVEPIAPSPAAPGRELISAAQQWEAERAGLVTAQWETERADLVTAAATRSEAAVCQCAGILTETTAGPVDSDQARADQPMAPARSTLGSLGNVDLRSASGRANADLMVSLMHDVLNLAAATFTAAPAQPPLADQTTDLRETHGRPPTVRTGPAWK